MSTANELAVYLQQNYPSLLAATQIATNELTVTVNPPQLLELCRVLRDDSALHFEQLLDVCGVDYLHYGYDEWKTKQATGNGFDRGVDYLWQRHIESDKPRFAVVYHLLSISHNHRLRLRVLLNEDNLLIDSVTDIWNSANWYERETFDLFGILFKGHPDLRRILTDYGFIGHPFRKDFPLTGTVEVRYDAAKQRVIYEPVSIQPQVNTPKVIRDDHRYIVEPTADGGQQHG